MDPAKGREVDSHPDTDGSNLHLHPENSDEDGTEEFQMSRSVFKMFQEEDAEMLDRMWKQDLKYGKIAQIPNRHQNA